MIITQKNAKKIAKTFKRLKKNIGLCHGCFDVFHFGHVNYFKKARSLCDVLFVSVSPDRFVKKGKNRPIFSCKQRMSVLNSLKYIDYVFVNAKRTALDSIKSIKPKIYFKGSDYLQKSAKNYKLFSIERQFVLKNKGQTLLLAEPSFSSTKILEKIKNKN